MAEAEEPPRPSRGGAKRMTLPEGERLRVTGLSLADPAAAGGQPHVRVWAEVGGEALVIGMLWSEQPVAAAAAPPLELGGEFVLLHDSAASSVRLYGYYLDPAPVPGGGGQPARRRFLVDIDAEEMGDEDDDAVAEEYEYEPLIDGDEEDLAETYDGDRGEDERDHGDGDEDGEAGVEVESLIEEELAERYDGDGDDEEEVEAVVVEKEEPSESREEEAPWETSKRRNICPGYSL